MPKININGVIREMNAGEIAEMERLATETQPEPTVEEQLAELRRQLAERDAMIIELAGAL